MFIRLDSAFLILRKPAKIQSFMNKDALRFLIYDKKKYN